MAVVKATSYTRDKDKAKATIRYIAHRPGKEGERTNRTLWTQIASIRKQDAYRMLDSAPNGSIFFRFAINPGPSQEDTHKDLYLRSITEATMDTLEERIGKQVTWIAATHTDHGTNCHRHVHVVAAVQGRLNADDLRSLTNRATHVCREQRLELDAVREAQRRREEEQQWDWAWY